MALGWFIWKCPYKDCKGCSRAPNTHVASKRAGKNHMKSVHNDYKQEPILERVEITTEEEFIW